MVNERSKSLKNPVFWIVGGLFVIEAAFIAYVLITRLARQD